MHAHRLGATLVVLCLVGSSQAGAASSGKEQVLTRDAAGTPTWTHGDLGRLKAGARGAAAVAFVAEHARRALGARGAEGFALLREHEDGLGFAHVRIQEQIAGLPVVGADLVLHAEVATGKVVGLNGRFAVDRDLPRRPKLPAEQAIEKASFAAGIERGEALGAPRLTYVLGEDETTHLAWVVDVRHFDGEGVEQLDRLFADALSGELVALHPQRPTARNRRTHTANGGTGLPGTLVIAEGGSSGDAVAQTAHNHVGTSWSYYNAWLGRDSYNGAGAALVTTVRYGTARPDAHNAFWRNDLRQMVFGSGFGTESTHWGNGLDVVAHELTHGVTQFESALVYSLEPGAINEALSDIAGATIEAWADGGVNADTWKIGEDVFTPQTAGDAVRYMSNPTADANQSSNEDCFSRDWYPERFLPSPGHECYDNGGVHFNSGIVNLAFYLLTQGGSHPRSKTTVSVPSLGINDAMRVFYNANRDYMTTNTGFVAARNATASAAAALWGAGSAQVTAVHTAWCAVGVPGCMWTFLGTDPEQFTCTPRTVTATVTNSFNGACTATCGYTWRYRRCEVGNCPQSFSPLPFSTSTISLDLVATDESIDLEATVSCPGNCGTPTNVVTTTIWGPASWFCGGPEG